MLWSLDFLRAQHISQWQTEMFSKAGLRPATVPHIPRLVAALRAVTNIIRQFMHQSDQQLFKR
jgi:hypothetical protein